MLLSALFPLSLWSKCRLARSNPFTFLVVMFGAVSRHKRDILPHWMCLCSMPFGGGHSMFYERAISCFLDRGSA